jgi:hypothetical protein
MKLEEEIIRGKDAELILSNYLYKEAFEKVEKDLIDALKSSPLGDDRTHNRIAIALQVLEQINNSFKTVMQTGKMAKIQISETVGDKVRKFVRR